MRNINFSVRGEKLIGKLFLPDVLRPKNPAVLLIHGWESRQDRGFILAEVLKDKGYICMTFDLRGHGDSEGDIQKLSRKDFVDDTIAAYDFFVKTRGVDIKNITAIGSSFGSYLAAILCSQRNVHSLILRAPANYRDEGFTEPLYRARKGPEHADWKLRGQDPHETEALRAVHNFKDRTLIVESEKDKQVPPAVVQSYVNAVNDKKLLTYVVMRGSPHSLSKDRPRQREFAEIVLNWIK